VNKLKPGKIYSIKLRAAYNGGGFVESRPVELRTKSNTGWRSWKFLQNIFPQSEAAKTSSPRICK
jgi:hypothetical protein